MTSNPLNTASQRPALQPSALGNLIKFDLCPRYFKFGIENTGFDELNHNQDAYEETFGSAGIVEKRSGDKFETDVVEDIKPAVTEFYDFEQVTLAVVAQTLPNLTSRTLTFDSKPEQSAIETGEFTFHGEHADSITLEPRDDDAWESDKDELSPGDPFAELRVAYTERVLGDLLANIDEVHAGDSIDYPLPRVNTSRSLSTTQTTRAIDDPIVLYQPAFATTIGSWFFSGDADLVFLWPSTPDTKPRIRVVDIKNVSEEQTNHQLQTVVYSTAITALDAVDTTQFDVETGVLTQESEYVPVTPSIVPVFDRESREADLKRLTKAGGRLDSIYFTEFNSLPYQLNDKCTNCQYNNACYSQALEEAEIELLGVDRGTQQKLRDAGIHTLMDLAALATPTDSSHHDTSDPKPKVNPTKKQTYNRLASESGLGERLPQLIQRAQALIGSYNKNFQHANAESNAVMLTNARQSTLPADTWPKGETIETANGGERELEYLSGSMIRVYLNVQYDHVRDCIIGLAARVTATASTAPALSVIEVQEEIQYEPEEVDWQEFELLDTFTDRVYSAIEYCGDNIDFSSVDQDNPFLHFYTFTEQERRVLEKALARYTATIPGTMKPRNNGGSSRVGPPTPPANTSPVDTDAMVRRLTSFRDLISRREGPDEHMFTAVLPEIESRMALKTPTSALINIYTQFNPYHEEDRLRPTDWTYTPSDSSRLPNGQTEVDLRKVFWYRFAANDTKYRVENDKIRLLYNDDGSNFDGWYNSRVREGARIPLAYHWAAAGELTETWRDDLDGDELYVIGLYRYHTNEQETRITTEDTKALMKHITHALCHVERGIDDTEKDDIIRWN